MPLPADLAPSLLARLTPRQSEIERWIRRAVEIESPSNDKPSLDRMADFLGDEFSAIGGRTKIHKSLTAGDQVQIDFPSRRGGKPVLVLGHHDTVWELGTLKSMPCHVTQGRIWGPGTLDMKAGLAQVLFALRALSEHFAGFPRPVAILSVSDEETGSHASRAVTESLAKKSAAVLVLEPAQGLEGALKTARKGVGEYSLKVHGRAAHAGVDFGSGGRPWVLEESSTGGASDGNFTAALGVPTLDGLGAVGEGAHAAHESVVLSEIPRRAALLAALIASI